MLGYLTLLVTATPFEGMLTLASESVFDPTVSVVELIVITTKISLLYHKYE